MWLGQAALVGVVQVINGHCCFDDQEDVIGQWCDPLGFVSANCAGVSPWTWWRTLCHGG
jgi:hypothetical protein